MLIKSRCPGQSFVIGGEYILTLVAIRSPYIVLSLAKRSQPEKSTLVFKLRLGESIQILPGVEVLNAGTVTCPQSPRRAGAACIGVSWSQDCKVYSKELFDALHAHVE